MSGRAPQAKLIHIATIPESFDYFRGQIGYLKAQGYEVQAISSPGKTLDRVRDQEAIEVHGIHMERSLRPLSDIVACWRLWRLLRTLRPDIVHSHTPKAALLGTIAARAAGIDGIVLSIFGLPQMTRTGAMRHLLNVVTRLSCSLADRIWCDSFSIRDYVARMHLGAAEKLFVLGHGSVNGVDTENNFSPLIHGSDTRERVRSHHAIPDDALVLGFVGRIVADKGIHELVLAWSALRDRYPSLHLLLVGPIESKDPILPEDGHRLRADPRIRLAGRRTDVAEHLAAMDVFVLPSYREGFGVSNIEAAAMALPVVSTTIPGCVDSVLDGQTGTLVPPRDAAALAAAIGRYCDDPALRRAHGQAGRQRVRRDFRQAPIWQALHEEYTRLLRHGSRRGTRRGAER